VAASRHSVISSGFGIGTTSPTISTLSRGFVQERLEELNARRAGDERFPVAGLTEEPNYRYVDIATVSSRGNPMTTPNDQQQELIDSKQGIHVVDAGAGPGRRSPLPVDTQKSSTRTTSSPGRPPRDVHQQRGDGDESESSPTVTTGCVNSRTRRSRRSTASVTTSSWNTASRAPTLLGIDDRITGSTRVLEDENVEKAQFREFIRRFSDDHPEYDDFFRAVAEPVELLGLINQLAAKGCSSDG